MRLIFNANKDTVEALKKIHEGYSLDESLGNVVIDAIHFLFQMETLMDAGYKLAIIDPNGEQHEITKRKQCCEDEDGTSPERED